MDIYLRAFFAFVAVFGLLWAVVGIGWALSHHIPFETNDVPSHLWLSAIFSGTIGLACAICLSLS